MMLSPAARLLIQPVRLLVMMMMVVQAELVELLCCFVTSLQIGFNVYFI
jgi:hypothetical protein